MTGPLLGTMPFNAPSNINACIHTYGCITQSMDPKFRSDRMLNNLQKY